MRQENTFPKMFHHDLDCDHNSQFKKPGVKASPSRPYYAAQMARWHSTPFHFQPNHLGRSFTTAPHHANQSTTSSLLKSYHKQRPSCTSQDLGSLTHLKRKFSIPLEQWRIQGCYGASPPPPAKAKLIFFFFQIATSIFS